MYLSKRVVLNDKDMITKLFTFLKKPFFILIILVLAIGIGIWSKVHTASPQQQYQTAQAEQGTLITSVSTSGTVTTANKVSITTQASGVVGEVYVKNGDTVTQGQKIADITLDAAGQQRQSAAWSNYLQAQNTLNSANAQLYTLQNQLFVANQKFVTDRGTQNPNTNDPVYIEENAAWLAAEAAYKNQSAVIAQAQASLTNTWLSYQQTASSIVAPSTGTLTDLILASGMQIGNSTTNSSSSNNNNGSSTNSSQSIASITTIGNPIVSVNIAEVDIPHVKVGQKVTITFDAFPDKTFTGKILGINTSGSVNSNVTTYPATIVLDGPSNDILPNMNATAKIITNIKDNVLLVPSGAVQTANGSSTVRVLKNGKVTNVPVEIGDTSDTQTEITSGLSEGDTVVVGSISNTGAAAGTSPFSGGLRFGGGFGGGGGNVRVIR